MCENIFQGLRSVEMIDEHRVYGAAFPNRTVYSDDEIDIDQSEFEEWLEKFGEEFSQIQHDLAHKTVDGNSTWYLDGKMVMFMLYQEDDIDEYPSWACGIHLPKKFLCVGNAGAHPFVETNKFSFMNSDGSTEEDGFPCQGVVDASKVLDFVREKVIDYLYNQEH